MSTKEEAVLRAATALFSEYGYHPVGIDAIIAKSKVAKMTFYKYFPSKNFLIESVLLRRDQELRESILAVVERCRTPMGKLKALFDWYEKWFSEPDFHGCMFIKASEEFPGEASKARQISQAHKTWLAGLIETILREAGAPSPRNMSMHILIVLDGLTVKSNMYDATPEKQTRVAWRYVKQMVQAHSVH